MLEFLKNGIILAAKKVRHIFLRGIVENPGTTAGLVAVDE
jgi:hypothetical protein